MKNKQNFIWSTSTCAFQIEGGRNEGGRTDSIWDEFTKRNFYIPPIGVPGREINSIEQAADFYHKYETDSLIMKNANLNGFIYNLDWNRIFPKNYQEINPEGIKWTENFFKKMIENEIRPIPILFHWDTPLWAQIQGGWENSEILIWWRQYVKTMFKFLGKYTDIWYVNDENSTFTLAGYLDIYLPPARNDKTAFVKAIHNLNLSGAIAKEEFELAKEKGYISKDSILGIVHDWNPPIPYDKTDKNDLKAIEIYNQWFLHFWLDPNMKGKYPEIFFRWIKENNIDFKISKKDLDFLKKNTLDFIGWNYYRPCYISGVHKNISEELLNRPTEQFFTKDFKIVYPIKDVLYTDWKWIIDSSRLVSGSLEMKNIYGDIPLMIVENGLGAFDDKTGDLIKDFKRIEYLKQHIEAVLEAKRIGVNFIGYSLWTYCDIYSPSGGYRKDYGLVSVDFNSSNKTRKPKLSYSWYKQVATSNGKDTSIDLNKLEKDLKNELKNWSIYMK
ncbi:aryl-phospho-beta-d-glucosidase [Williamsoniiplasma somnilux]|uniref:Aryl-phospho-beta-d-glucosidase n=1 Tax=Williamsoniiplasma somnilux TaxID=215578 RepID=A0A2K8NYL9_9MOLU|nr:family 1 glycosylhydrolase [Williamsoniiplasma somnilux]ATZ18920.1 aryl-phospho-beta-d-glucosidase [Williamsoniiplasma somnilux]